MWEYIAEDKAFIVKVPDNQKEREQEQLRLTQEAQKATDAKQRREEFEQRWLEIKRRLLEEERIKGLDQEARNQGNRNKVVGIQAAVWTGIRGK